MKLHLVFSLFHVVFVKATRKNENRENHHTFSAVTAFQGLTSLYLRMKIREPHLDPDITTDVETKKRVCQSITKSGYFDLQFDEDGVDMDAVFPDLEARVDEEKRNDDFQNNFFVKVLRDYEEKKYTYCSRLVHFCISEAMKIEEFASACVTKDRDDGTLNLYYISDQYDDISVALDSTTTKQIRARFVCLTIGSHCRLVALAEEPSRAYVALNQAMMGILEHLYLRSKKSRRAETADDDPLCSLTRSEKLRVCASVLNVPHLTDVIKFNPDQSSFKGDCRLNRISFRSTANDAEGEAALYDEWMMPCRAVDSNNPEIVFVYYVSRAYDSHAAFIYSRHPWNGKWFIDYVCGAISVLVEKKCSIEDDSEDLELSSISSTSLEEV